MARTILVGRIGTLLVCLAFVSPAVGASNDNPATGNLKSLPFTLIVEGHSQANTEGVFQLNERQTVWESKNGSDIPFMDLRSISAELENHKLKVHCEFQFRGPEDPDRSICTEMRLLDENGKLLFHDWEISEDARIGPLEIPMGSYMGTRSTWNSPSLRADWNVLPQVLPHLARAEIRFRELHKGGFVHFPSEPHKLNLQISRPDACGNFDVTFTNRPGWNLEPEKHQIAFQVFTRDANNKLVRADRRFLVYRADGNYSQRVRVEPKYYDHSSISISVYTRQPDNNQFILDFFLGGGSGYSGVWTGDGGKLSELPLVGVPVFNDLPELAQR